MSLIESLLVNNQTIILDGGMGSELERRGFNINDPLWSAKILLETPEAIQAVHSDFLKAGADCITTATYQATFEGLKARGLSDEDSRLVLDLACELASEAIDQFWQDPANRVNRSKPFAAVSIGPYGAFLGNGAEYTGDYGPEMDIEKLAAFHRPRWHYLSDKIDLFACETIPNKDESLALSTLLSETPHLSAWFSFSCRDGEHIADGTPIETCIAGIESNRQIKAVGINCTQPRYVPELIQRIQSISEKPIIVYPNTGEIYDAVEKRWSGEKDLDRFGSAAKEWRKMGAMLIGGCCRTTPTHIQAISGRIRTIPR